ncbi:MAG: hypothetical protein LBV41_08345 [Cytophagaceae bacterium]|jgi:hypothetical protein|nr:hypothetical protein [Cytophagaceae bacterium]
MKTLKQILAVAMLLGGLLFYACVEDSYNLSLDPAKRNLRKTEIEGPIGAVNAELMKWLKASLTEKDSAKVGDMVKVFKKGEYYDPAGVDYEGVVYMQFNDSIRLDWLKLKTMVNLQDIVFSTTINNPLSKSVHEVEITSQYQPLIIREDADYRQIAFSSAYLDLVDIDIPSGINGSMKVRIPEIKIGQQPFEHQIEFANGTITGSQQVTLNNGTIDFVNNGVNIGGEVIIDSFNDAYVTGDISFKVTLRDFDVISADGYFGQDVVEEKDQEFKFTIFEELQILDGSFAFGDIILEALVDNEIGVPFDITAENIRVYNKEEAPVGNLAVNDGLTIDVTSAVKGGSNGKGYVMVNQKNSNIATLATELPNKLVFDVTGLSNQQGNTGVANFIDRNSMLDVDLSLKFPFHFQVSTYSRKDTIDFDAKKLYGDYVTQASDLEYLNLYFTCENRLPFDAGLVVSVIDSIGAKIGDFTTKEGKKILEGGDRTNPGTTVFTISLTGDQAVDYIAKNAKKIVLETSASTTKDGTELVKIYEDSGLKIIITFDAKLTVPTKFE